MNKAAIVFLFLISSVTAYGQTGELRGNVTQKNTENIIDDAAITIYYGDSVFASIVPDFHGEYVAGNLPAGRVTVICKKDSFATLIEKNIPIIEGKTTIENFALRKTTRSNDIDLIEYKGADAVKEEVSLKEERPAKEGASPTVKQVWVEGPTPIITLLADSEVVKGSSKQGWYFKIGNSELFRLKFFAGNLAYHLNHNPDAAIELNKYVKMKGTKMGLQIGFGALMGLYAGSFFFDKKSTEFFGGYRAALLGGGLVCIGVSAFLDEKKDKHLKKAVEIYNAGK